MTGTVICKKLNIRSKPNKNSEVICVVDEGEILQINGISDDGWARVYTDKNVEIKGYAMKEFLKEN